MLTRQEAERIAQAVNALRPDWPIPSLLNLIWKHKDRPLLDVAVELTWVALLPDTKTPGRIDADGPWKHATKAAPRENVVSYRAASPLDCATCGRPKGQCIDDEHDYEPAHARTRGVPRPKENP